MYPPPRTLFHEWGAQKERGWQGARWRQEVRQGGAALGVFLATNLAAYYGFDPSAVENTKSAKFALACLYSVIPALLACIALPLLWKYPLTRERQHRMRAHIERRDARRRTQAL